uniref:B box-type domain-containing protein n=1 Tax=Clastoptera arizonana TaxID=38151 RepID=A0A1B6E883_9HEMI
MFSSHDIVHMSKCSKEVHRRCAVHGEQYIMFSNSQRNMLCVNCFRDTPAEARLHCVDIDTAYTQSNKKLDRSISTVREIQNSVREGVITYRNLLEELQQSTDSEKLTIQSFCQGMLDAINKTQASMVLEIQRQYESKERLFKSHLMNLSAILPTLQMHLMLCQGFASAANKFQFLDLAYPMMDRLALVSQLSQPIRPSQSSQIRTNYKSEFAQSLEPWIGKSSFTHHPANTSESSGMYEDSQASGIISTSQGTSVGSTASIPLHPAPSRKQHSALRAKALEGEGPFSNHCRSFDTQIKEISGQLASLRDRLLELQRDVTLLRRAATPPLAKRHLSIARDCEKLDDTLQRYHVELDRLRSVFDTLWQEQLYRIHVEQDIFRSQMNDIVSLRCEVKQLATVAQQLEPYVKTLSSQTNLEEVANLQALIDRISLLKASEQHQSHNRRPNESRQMMSPTSDGDGSCKPELPTRETIHPRPTTSQGQTFLDTSIYGRSQPAESRARGVISQLIEKVRIKEDRKKSPVQEEIRGPILRERSKSEGRGKDLIRTEEQPKSNPPDVDSWMF